MCLLRRKHFSETYLVVVEQDSLKQDEKVMLKFKQIDHKANILEIKDGTIRVAITSESACASCHAKGACGLSNTKEKQIEIIHSGNEYRVGDEVNLLYRESLAWVALFLAYVLPCLLVLFVLFIMTAVMNNELMGGLLSLGILLPYYFILSFFKNRLKKSFLFTIEKMVNT